MRAYSGHLEVRGHLVLDDAVAPGRLTIEDGRIAAVDIGDEAGKEAEALPYVAPGFVDVHVHAWGGHDAMGATDDPDGMARALLQHGVTSFLPPGVTHPPPATRASPARAPPRTPLPPAPAPQPPA